jgi:hypothetical protein
MTDGAIPALIALVVAVSAATVGAFAAVVGSQRRDGRRRRAAEDEAMALRGSRLRAEVRNLEIRSRDLRTEIAQLQTRRADLVVSIQAQGPGRDPAAALAAGALTRAQIRPNRELTRRLERAGEAQIIPFPFLATGD